MGEIAEDCYDRAFDELEDRDYEQMDMYERSAPYRRPDFVQPQPPPKLDFKFTTIDRKWPFADRGFLVQAYNLTAAICDFYINEWHVPFKEDQRIPDMREVEKSVVGWIVYGDTQTVLIQQR